MDVPKQIDKNGIFIPELFWPTFTKNCSSDREKLLKFEAEGLKFAKILRSLEQFNQTLHWFFEISISAIISNWDKNSVSL